MRWKTRKWLKNSAGKGRRGGKKQRKARQIGTNLDRFVRAICSDNVTNVQFKKDGNFQSTRARSPKKARRNFLREHPRHA